MVEGALSENLVERDAGEVGRLHRAHQIVAGGQTGEGVRILGIDLLTTPPHLDIRTYVRVRVKPSDAQAEIASAFAVRERVDLASALFVDSCDP